MRRSLLIAGLLLALVAAGAVLFWRSSDADAAPTAASGPLAPPRRVFLVTIDTLRADHLGFMGYPRPVSPFLDSLAADGLVFERAYSASSTTTACHASLFTGLQPAQHGLVKNGIDMDPSLLTLAEVLHQNGYATAGFSTANFMRGVAQGFDHFEPEKRFFPAPHLVDQALAWLAEREDDEPFFLWLHLFDVHEWVKPEHVDPALYAEAQAMEPSGEALLELLRDEHAIPADAWPSDRQLLAAIDRYDAQILRVDRQLERLWQAVAEAGLDEDALWILTADHGEGLGNHYEKGHGAQIYNEQVHVPLVLVGDAVKEHRRIDSLVRHVDLMPTVAALVDPELAAAELPIDGTSLLPLLDHGGHAARYAYSQRRDADELRLGQGWDPGHVVSLQTPELKYIYRSDGEDELYDLVRDPRELHDLGDDHPEGRKMRDFLVKRFAEMSAEGERLGSGEVNPEYVQQLKALGYM